jgi:hypothetical protein
VSSSFFVPAHFFGAPTHLGIMIGNDYRFLTIPQAREAVGDAWIQLDEVQFAIDAVPEDRHGELRALARARGVGPKTWWQFWR